MKLVINMKLVYLVTDVAASAGTKNVHTKICSQTLTIAESATSRRVANAGMDDVQYHEWFGLHQLVCPAGQVNTVLMNKRLHAS